MNPRMDIAVLQPAQYQAMLELDKAVGRHDVPKPLVELVKLRASQINGCAYCVDMHSFDAKAAGEPDERIYAVAVWQETPYFTETERAAFALTESMTRLSDASDRVPDEIWRRAAKAFDEPALAAVVMIVATVNAWNRICVATRMVPSSFQAG